METLAITRDEFEELKRLQIRHRWRWPAIFSTNFHREIWPYAGPGYTKVKERLQVRGVSKIIDAVADQYLRTRKEGGRFFIDEKGAFYTEQGRPQVQFLVFLISEPK